MNKLSDIYKALDAQHQSQAFQKTGGPGAQAYMSSDKNPGKVAATYQAYMKSLNSVPTLASGVKQAIPKIMRQMGAQK